MLLLKLSCKRPQVQVSEFSLLNISDELIVDVTDKSEQIPRKKIKYYYYIKFSIKK
jgi:hypothetical protein